MANKSTVSPVGRPNRSILRFIDPDSRTVRILTPTFAILTDTRDTPIEVSLLRFAALRHLRRK